nr:MAG TPA: hypothetical protein [Bacteriophage sp.]
MAAGAARAVKPPQVVPSNTVAATTAKRVLTYLSFITAHPLPCNNFLYVSIILQSLQFRNNICVLFICSLLLFLFNTYSIR